MDAPLNHVLRIGGGSAAGKTTVARRIARRHGLRWNNADARTWEHRDRALRDGHSAECDDPACDEIVELPIAAFPRSPSERLLAAGHR